MTNAIRETRQCPPEFQERITRMFGVNKFGTPHYRIGWAQNEFQQMGFSRYGTDGIERVGYELRYRGAPMPCWSILRWKDPSNYGSPDLYYDQTFMDNPMMYFLGEYPWQGRYEILYNLCRKEFVDGKLVVDALQLCHTLIDKIIPLLIEAQYLTNFERQAAKQMVKEYEHKKAVNELSDRMMNDLPSFYGPVSYAHQGCRTSLLDRKMGQIQKKWDELSRGGRPLFKKGMGIGERPHIVGRVS